MKRRTEAAAYDCIPTLEAKLKHYCKPCENDDLSCPDLLEDFHHVFAHVKERETLEQILVCITLNFGTLHYYLYVSNI